MRILSVRETAWFNIDPQETWESICNLEEWPQWCQGLESARWAQGEAWKPGSRFELIWEPWGGAPLSGGVIVMDDVVALAEPNLVSPPSLRGISWIAGMGPFRSQVRLIIMSDGGGSLVEFVSSWKGWASLMIGPRAERCANLQRDWLASLREILERVGSQG
ncbi:MAG: SRPBCC family protein [Planctomycetota bacterium]|nr:SRPBCC family protein [Planctomycetota bacterium]